MKPSYVNNKLMSKTIADIFKSTLKDLGISRQCIEGHWSRYHMNRHAKQAKVYKL